MLKSSCLELAEVRVEGGKGHQRHGWVLESLVRHQGRPKGTSTGGGDPPRDGNALSERESNPSIIIIKCFDLSLSWFLEVPRADLSVPPHLSPSTLLPSSRTRFIKSTLASCSFPSTLQRLWKRITGMFRSTYPSHGRGNGSR